MLKIKKKMNFRYFLVLALSLIAVIYFSMICLKTILLKTIFIVFLSIILLLTIVLFIKHRKKTAIIVISIIGFLIFSTVNLILRQNYVNNFVDFDGKTVVVTGRISSELAYTDSGNVKIYIDNLKIIDDVKVTNTSSELVVYIKPTNLDVSKIKIGYKIELFSTLNIYSFSNAKDFNSISKGLIGYLFTDSTGVTISDKMYTKLDERVRSFVYDKLCSWNMKHADTAFAMFFGKTSYIESGISNVFKLTGTTHILAVSGMHITIIIAFVHFIFKKLKVHRKFEFITLLVVLPIYNYLCDFSISVVRASIMALISTIAYLSHRINNRLSSLSFTAVLVLIFNPLNLFNYSFILSFSTILIIILLFPCIKRLTDKLFYNSFSNAFSLCLSTQIGLTFVQIYLFQNLSLLSFVANLIIIPLTTFAFEYLLIMFPLMFAIPPLSFLSKIFDVVLSISIKFGNYIAKLGLFFVTSGISVILPILSFVLMFIISDYFFETRKNKIILSSFLIFTAIIVYSLSILLV